VLYERQRLFSRPLREAAESAEKAKIDFRSGMERGL